jgi:hypothetical protein
VTPEDVTPWLERIAAAESSLGDAGATPDELARRREIVGASGNLLAGVGDRGRVQRSELDSFARAMGPLLAASTDDAGCRLVRALDGQVERWRATMSAEEWSRLVVVIRASHQARYRNAVTQYFAWKLGPADGPPGSYPGESARVIYAESLRRDDEPLDLGASVALDAELSRAFLGDRWRLSEDVLSDGAARCIAELARAGGSAVAP